MRAVARRIAKLEGRFGSADGKPSLLLVMDLANSELALDQDACIEILDECGFLPTRGMGLVDPGKTPYRLNADELETFLRENGAELCNLCGAQTHSGPASARSAEASRGGWNISNPASGRLTTRWSPNSNTSPRTEPQLTAHGLPFRVPKSRQPDLLAAGGRAWLVGSIAGAGPRNSLPISAHNAVLKHSAPPGAVTRSQHSPSGGQTARSAQTHFTALCVRNSRGADTGL